MKILVTKGDGIKGKKADAELVTEEICGVEAQYWRFGIDGIRYLWPEDWARPITKLED